MFQRMNVKLMKINGQIYSLISFILLIIGSIDLFGQQLFEYHTKTIDDGLADRVVNFVTRDKFGYFYLSTDSGIQQYDGSSFTAVDGQALTSSKKANSDILGLCTIEGDVFIKTTSCEYLYIIKAGTTVVTQIKLPRSYSLLSDGSRIIGYYYHNKNYYSDEICYPKLTIKRFSITSTKPIYYSTINNTKYVSDGNTVFDCTNISPSFNKQIKHKGIIASSNEGLWLVGNYSVTLLNSKNKLDTVFTSSLKSEPVVYKNDKKGNLIVAFSNQPRYISNLKVFNGSKVMDIDTLLNFDNIFLDFYTDDVSHKIITCGYQGIKIFEYLQEGFSHVMNQERPDNFSGTIIIGVAVSKKDEVLFTEEVEGLYQLDVKTKQIKRIFEHYRGPGNSSLERNQRIYYSKDVDKFYLLNYTYSNTSFIHEIDLVSQQVSTKLIPFKVNDLTLKGKTLYVLGYDMHSGAGRIATIGLEVFNEKEQIVFTYKHQITSLYYNEKTSQFWIGTSQGILVLDEGYIVKKVLDRNQKNVKYYLAEDNIRAISSYNGLILASTIGAGVVVLDPKSYAILNRLQPPHNLSDQKTTGSIVDNNGLCWIPSWNGLNVLNKDLSSKRVFYRQDGIKHTEFNTKAYAKDSEGKLYFGTMDGLLIVDPLRSLAMPTSHGLHLKSIESFKNGTITPLERLDVKTNVDSIHLTFNMPDYISHRFGTPQIFTTPINNGILISAGNKVSISNIKRGKEYINLHTNNSDRNAILVLKAGPDYTYFLIALGALIFILAGGNLLIKRITKKEELKTEYNRRIVSLELSALQAQMNPHFIFNALSAVQYFIQVKDVEKADEFLSKFASLMRMILESSKSQLITITNEVKLLQLYISLEQARFEDVFEYKIEVDKHVDINFRIAPMLLQPYVENAINHGLVNLKNSKGKLLIKITQPKENLLHVVILDNGVGRSKAMELRTKKHKSRGTEIAHERIDTINKTENLFVTSTTEDLFDQAHSAIGTKVSLTFKLDS